MHGIITSGQVRYFTNAGVTNGNASAFALAAGRFETLTGAENAVNRIWTMEAKDGRLARGLEIVFFGSGANNDSFDYRLWQVKCGKNKKSPENTDHAIAYLGGGTATLSTKFGVSGGVVSDSERIADTITWTRSTTSTSPRGPMEVIETAYGLSVLAAAYSPADDTPARLIIPDLGNAEGVILEFAVTANGLSANALLDNSR